MQSGPGQNVGLIFLVAFMVLAVLSLRVHVCFMAFVFYIRNAAGWPALLFCFARECYCFITRNVSSLFCVTQSETCNISPREEFLSLIQLGNLNFSISLTEVLYCFVVSYIIMLHNSCVHITAKYNNNMQSKS